MALPHAKIASVTDYVMALGRCPRGIEFDSLDGQPVRLIALIGAIPLARSVYEKVSDLTLVRAVVMPAFYVLVLVISIAYVVDSSFNPFLYFRF